MQTLSEQFRSLGFTLFSDAGVFVLFSPETLQLFTLNERAAKIASEIIAGSDVGDVASAHGVRTEQVTRLLSRIINDVQQAPLAYEQQPPMPQAQTPLPKLVLMVNNYCNLKCTYCYEHEAVFTKPPVGMSTALARTAIDKFFSAFSAIRTIMFIGGEPTLNPEVLEFACGYASEKAGQRGQDRPAFCMISNGVKMDDKVFALISQYEIQTTFSLDGPRKVNDLVRIRHDNTGTFDDVKGNLQRYAAQFPDRVGLECTVSEAHGSSGISIKDLLLFAATELGVKQPHIAAAGIRPGAPLDPYRDGGARLTREFKDAAEHSVASLLEGMTSEGRYNPTKGSLDMVSSMFEAVLRRDGFISLCPAGTSQLVVDTFGDVYPCWMFAGKTEFCMGNIVRDDIFNDVAARVLERIAKNNKKANPQCSRCYARYACSACIGNNYNATGAIESISEAFCDTIRGSLATIVVSLGKARQDPNQWNSLLSAAQHARDSHGAAHPC